MAIKRIGVITGGNIQKYQCATTDNAATYPTDCGAGSVMTVINTATKKVDKFLLYDGTNWNEL